MTCLSVLGVCAVHVCVSVPVCSYVSQVDTKTAQDQPAMTDWRRLLSCCLRFCGELVHSQASVCMRVYLWTTWYVCLLFVCVWRWKTRPGLVWAKCKIAVVLRVCVFVCEWYVCVAGPVADVVHFWSFAGDFCLHIYLHDCLCVHVSARVCTYVLVWTGMGILQKSTSVGYITKNICLADGNMSLSLALALLRLITRAGWGWSLCVCLCACLHVCLCVFAGCGWVNPEAAQTADMTHCWQPNSPPHQPCIILAS